MITDAIIRLLFTVPTWLIGQLPTITIPTFFHPGTGPGTIGGYFQEFASYLGAMNNWFPFDQVGVCLTFVVAALGVAVAVKFARIAASFATLGGGSAA